VSAPARPGSILKVILIPLAAVCALAGGLLLWASFIKAPMPEALAALRGTRDVKVTVQKWGVFEPTTGKPKVGLVIYPASRVDWRAYAPLAVAISRKGFLVVVVPMPLNLAALDPARAESVIKAFHGIHAWAIAGHGEGGAMAARFVARHPRLVRALILWGARPAAGDNLGAARVCAMSISADRDGIVPPLVIKGSAWLLPATTLWVTIMGGNHSQFGWYGSQGRDGKALISRPEQQAKVVRSTVELLRSIGD
jgi:hypothetical protein